MDTRRFVIDDRPRPGRARTAHRPRALPAVRAGVDHMGPRPSIRDAITIWFAYAVGREVRIIDYDKASGVGLGHYARVIVSRPYVCDTSRRDVLQFLHCTTGRAMPPKRSAI